MGEEGEVGKKRGKKRMRNVNAKKEEENKGKKDTDRRYFFTNERKI